MPAVVKKATSAATPKNSPSKPAITIHPTYRAMVTKAVKELNEKGGSSKQAIVKYISANFKVGDKVDHQVKLTLRKMCQNKELLHASKNSTGANGSFKLPAKEPASKKPKTSPKKSPTKTTSEKTPAIKNTKAAKSPVKQLKKSKNPKKPTVKKATPVKKFTAKKTQTTN
ncbi:histone H1-delta-like [Convolutriloba macropyga]|uniref:histone H1-delta-like n=1 Tax=Convolutriloba macropyga TaxID=536237 RepID=UPI003F51DC2A